MRVSPRSGWTLIEVLISLALVALLIGKGSLMFKMMDDVSRSEPIAMALEDQANQVVDRIALAIIGSDRDMLFPQFQAPVHTSSISYTVSLGVQNGVVVWDDPEEISHENGDTVVWFQNPDQVNEKRVVWTKFAQPFLEGELQNGVDDTGNGLIDEEGLTFVLVGNSITIRLSLGRVVGEDEDVRRTVETTVTIRNRPD